MAKYCITAANHKNPDNHCASSFMVWEFRSDTDKWHKLGGKSLNYVSDLLAAEHEVLSAKEKPDSIAIGAPVEVELRISKNGTQYKISDMPPF